VALVLQPDPAAQVSSGTQFAGPGVDEVLKLDGKAGGVTPKSKYSENTICMHGVSTEPGAAPD
jgi:hypothetical protein